MQACDVVIVGGGLAGLSCATQLAQDGIEFCLLEATDRVGGRVRTDTADGFLLDHGFQVLLTAYPACQQLLDYDALQLQRFEPGATIRLSDAFATLSDPWRQPSRLLQTALAPVGTLRDKLRIGKLRRQACEGTLEDLYERAHSTSLQRLQDLGFSPDIIEQFFRPWLGGVFLECELSTSSRMLEFVFRMFALGDAAVPAGGMQQIPLQLLGKLPQGSVRLQSTVESIRGHTLGLSDGSAIRCRQLVIATESSAAERLLSPIDGGAAPEPPFVSSWNATTCLYFAAATAPLADARLVLAARDTEGRSAGPVNHLAVLSNVAPQYAPPGQSLISVNLLGQQDRPWELEQPVRRQLASWFGAAVDDWRLLRTYHLPYALPSQSVAAMPTVVRPPYTSADHADVIVCGDHCETRSIQGAMNSGLRAAKIVSKKFGQASSLSKHG